MGSLAFDGTPNNTPVGYFTYVVEDDYWVWSTGLYVLHGYEPQQVEVTTELMLRHKHPDDSARAFDVLENVMTDAQPFSCYHRIIDTQGHVRSVLAVGRGHLGAHGMVEQVTGFYVDLTEVRRSEVQNDVEEALAQIAKTRSVIDQAKGIVMAGAACDAGDAFLILRTSSSRHNIKLRELCRRLVTRVSRPVPHQENLRFSDALNLLSDPELFDPDLVDEEMSEPQLSESEVFERETMLPTVQEVRRVRNEA
jgi:hypothetical protein